MLNYSQYAVYVILNEEEGRDYTDYPIPKPRVRMEYTISSGDAGANFLGQHIAA